MKLLFVADIVLILIGILKMILGFVTRKRTLWHVGSGAAIVIMGALLLEQSCSTDVGLRPDCARIEHAKGKPCREHWTLVPKLFTERDGSQQDACVQGDLYSGCGETDYLMPGESEQMRLRVPAPSHSERVRATASDLRDR